ncbi:MAG: hypothetical protein GX620_11055 [Chloroflexi bacterium]|nr:hypothetical protein [Chloroflexota bacterium]
MRITFVSSDGRCGIYEYTQVLRAGFGALGHATTYVGVPRWDNRALRDAVRRVDRDCDCVVFEYEPGIFRLRALVRAIAYLRIWRRKPVLLSVHEIEAAKYPEYHHIQQRLSQPVRFGRLLEYPRIAWSTLDVALRYLVLRLFLYLLGQFSGQIVVHSSRARENIGLITGRVDQVPTVPLVIKSQDGDVGELRDTLHLPQERFVFIVPGFIFRRKRIVEVINQLPADATLLVVGTPAVYEPEYVQEVVEHAASRSQLDVRVIQDYERMELYLLASDAVVLYYQDGYQSASACLALGAGKPCVFSSLPAFAIYQEGGLVAANDRELGSAMQAIRDPETYNRLHQGALVLRDRYSPSRIAAWYLDTMRELF